MSGAGWRRMTPEDRLVRDWKCDREGRVHVSCNELATWLLTRARFDGALVVVAHACDYHVPHGAVVEAEKEEASE